MGAGGKALRRRTALTLLVTDAVAVLQQSGCPWRASAVQTAHNWRGCSCCGLAQGSPRCFARMSGHSGVRAAHLCAGAGQTRQQHLYFSQETAQRWGGPVADPEDGAALWLPGRLLLQLRMVPPVSPNSAFLWRPCSLNPLRISVSPPTHLVSSLIRPGQKPCKNTGA